ncbi:hypothetical protein BOTBODRAFT_31550 [Botryobasidium botryosum FD-172 SS1]|uniref:Uncharacterized protein n=1 Tax=Botryobasidium botryosum (strain FD-172 SS1) TaxID=930990 RepID=A0A067MIQ9_BOTB1|nr:hypothetical protein BOTBODRAFT_31550 [Botryobasidium botryosum FD-172 SS1]
MQSLSTQLPWTSRRLYFQGPSARSRGRDTKSLLDVKYVIIATASSSRPVSPSMICARSFVGRSASSIQGGQSMAGHTYPSPCRLSCISALVFGMIILAPLGPSFSPTSTK